MKPDHERIWLQPGAGDCGETTWCQDRIHDDDIEYVRKDIHDAALLEAHQRGRREGMEAAKRIRDTAMQQTLAARIPESGHFGAEVWREMAPLRDAVSGPKAGRWITIRAKIKEAKP